MKKVATLASALAMSAFLVFTSPVAAQTTDNTTGTTIRAGDDDIDDDDDDDNNWGWIGLLGLAGLLGLRRRDDKHVHADRRSDSNIR